MRRPLDEYMDIFEQAQERSLAPTIDLTSEASVNVPFPVFPGALGAVAKQNIAPAPTQQSLAPARQNVVPSGQFIRTNQSLVNPGGSIVRSSAIQTNAQNGSIVRRATIRTNAPQAPLLIPGLTPTSKAAGSAAPTPSPASGSPSPSVPDYPPIDATPSSSSAPIPFDMSTTAPPVETPSAPSFNAGPLTTNLVNDSMPSGCPSCPVSGGTLLLLVAASLYAGHLLTQKSKTVA